MEIKRIRIFSNNNKKSLGIKDILISKLEENGFIINPFSFNSSLAILLITLALFESSLKFDKL